MRAKLSYSTGRRRLVWKVCGGMAVFVVGWGLMYVEDLQPIVELPVLPVHRIAAALFGPWLDWLFTTLALCAYFFFCGFLAVGVAHRTVLRRQKTS